VALRRDACAPGIAQAARFRIPQPARRRFLDDRHQLAL